MHRILKCDLARVLFNRGFAAAVIATAVLCFFTQVYSESANERAYSAMEALFMLKRDFMAANSEFSPPVIIRKALGGYSSMLLPVTASFPFVFSFISEQNSGNMLFTISRASRLKYYFSKFVSAISCGGFCTMFGVILFGIFAYILFPSANSSDLLAQTFPNGVLLALVKKALSAFVYGMVSVLPSFFLCSFCKNPYIILCSPFLLKFILETFLSKLQTDAFAAEDFDTYEKLSPFFPDAISSVFDIRVDKQFFIIIVLNAVFATAAFAGFSIIMKKRLDRGR